MKVRGFHQGQGYQSVTPAEGRIYVSNRFSASRKPCAEAGSIYALTSNIFLSLPEARGPSKPGAMTRIMPSALES